jgi:predicted solute-binding protein
VNPWGALHALRIGCVRYLNSKPLIHGYDGAVRLDHPSVLARELAAGQLDAALVPVFEVLRDPRYVLADEVAIACDGPVWSVVLIHPGELHGLRRVRLDPASLTSANLLRVLLAEFHGLHPEFGPEGDAQLLIGNQAIEYRAQHPAGRVLDLGEEWLRRTGLPFVFAVWALRPDLPCLSEAAAAFRALKDHGLAHREEIVARDQTATPDFRRRYLTEHIRFDLGPREKQGLARYRELLVKHRLITSAAEPLRMA